MLVQLKLEMRLIFRANKVKILQEQSATILQLIIYFFFLVIFLVM
jgi:hypothetical protein